MIEILSSHLQVLAISATVAFLISTFVSTGIGLYFYRKYPQREALGREQAMASMVTIFFMVMTIGYTAVGVFLNRLDPIPLSFFVAGVFGVGAGAKVSEKLKTIGGAK